MSPVRWVSTLLVALVLSGCGSGLSGTYADASGLVSYTFDGNEVTGAINGGGPALVQTGTRLPGLSMAEVLHSSRREPTRWKVTGLL